MLVVDIACEEVEIQNKFVQFSFLRRTAGILPLIYLQIMLSSSIGKFEIQGFEDLCLLLNDEFFPACGPVGEARGVYFLVLHGDEHAGIGYGVLAIEIFLIS
jgi:hypothetical protein